MITAVYLVSHDGRLIYNYDTENEDVFNAGITEATLFSGIITAIQSVMKEIDAGEVSNFNTKKQTIYLKSTTQMVYVVITSLDSKYKQHQIDQFIKLLEENFSAQFDREDHALSSSENAMLNTIIKMLLNQWMEAQKESKAAKTLKEDLW